ncbi:polya polymerase [Chrysochromulina tobinii]|uniref:Polya polymerase n=1 Tax=Chrysochromulina tobinii TaxID=1460289 RepID=A0A0M0J8D6_9EUKA|nr:polya polymerase [Chrysochromulina tobinii]|eukprot:KOO22745.1 polya polymerase [Chrysochromulina sp. CCMP291]
MLLTMLAITATFYVGIPLRPPSTLRARCVIAATPKTELDEACNVVLTHTNTDFDSLAGAVALAKLWSIERPEVPTHVVMPRGVNPLVGRFLAYHKHLLPIRGFKTIRAVDIGAIGVVDTQSANRLGPAAAWLENASHVAVYDHHSCVDGDINPTELHLEPVGSVTTVLVEELQKHAHKIKLSETEATLFALGIRADTGALSFPSTTPRDGRALVYLMEQGASQLAIAEFGQARLSAVQRDLLASAMRDVQSCEHEGLKVGTVCLDTGRGFVTGMSAVCEELLQLLSFDALLLGITHRNAKQQSFLSLIGRCSPRASAVDLNDVMGQPAVAVEEVDELPRALPNAPPSVVAEARSLLNRALEHVISQVPEQPTAEDLMTKTVFSCSPGDTMEEAMKMMNRIAKKAVPVIDDERKLMGMLKFSDVVKAEQAGKGQQLVKVWMRRDVVTIAPEAKFDKVEQLIIDTGSGRLPVTDENGVLLGLVTRTDVLRQHRMYGRLGRGARRVR